MVYCPFRSSAIEFAVLRTERLNDPIAVLAQCFAALGRLLLEPRPKHLLAEDVRSTGPRSTVELNTVHQRY